MGWGGKRDRGSDFEEQSLFLDLHMWENEMPEREKKEKKVQKQKYLVQKKESPMVPSSVTEFFDLLT